MLSNSSTLRIFDRVSKNVIRYCIFKSLVKVWSWGTLVTRASRGLLKTKPRSKVSAEETRCFTNSRSLKWKEYHVSLGTKATIALGCSFTHFPDWSSASALFSLWCGRNGLFEWMEKGVRTMDCRRGVCNKAFVAHRWGWKNGVYWCSLYWKTCVKGERKGESFCRTQDKRVKRMHLLNVAFWKRYHIWPSDELILEKFT